jgi:hypothetical protein
MCQLSVLQKCTDEKEGTDEYGTPLSPSPSTVQKAIADAAIQSHELRRRE